MEFLESSLILANLAVALASFVQTSAGLGLAMLGIPLLAVIDLSYVPGPFMLVSLALNLMMFVSGRSDIVYSEIRTMFPALVLGTICGAILFDIMPHSILGVIFAALILTGVAITVLAKPIGLGPTALRGGGFSVGLMGTISGIHGPPLVLLYHNEAIEKTRASIALIFLMANTLSLIGLTSVGQFTEPDALRGLTLLPGLLFGYILAKNTRHFLSKRVARMMMLSIAAASAGVLLFKSLPVG